MVFFNYGTQAGYCLLFALSAFLMTLARWIAHNDIMYGERILSHRVFEISFLQLVLRVGSGVAMG